eukprot:Nk52_evm10s311 gene=Nk52_evmTU10s311
MDDSSECSFHRELGRPQLSCQTYFEPTNSTGHSPLVIDEGEEEKGGTGEFKAHESLRVEKFAGLKINVTLPESSTQQFIKSSLESLLSSNEEKGTYNSNLIIEELEGFSDSSVELKSKKTETTTTNPDLLDPPKGKCKCPISSLEQMTLQQYAAVSAAQKESKPALIQRGRFSKIFAIRDSQRSPPKCYKIVDTSCLTANTEAVVCRELAKHVGKCPNVIDIFSVEDEMDVGGFMKIEMERVSLTPIHIFSLLPWDGFPYPLSAYLLEQLSNGIDHLHSLNIIHGDLRPCNILLKVNGNVDLTDVSYGDDGYEKAIELASKSVVKICDLGSALYSDPHSKQASQYIIARNKGLAASNRSLKLFPELAYVCPEVVSDIQNISYRSDSYALGVIVHEGIFGTIPHSFACLPNSKNPPNISPEKWESTPEYIREMILSLIAHSPQQRITCSEAHERITKWHAQSSTDT